MKQAVINFINEEFYEAEAFADGFKAKDDDGNTTFFRASEQPAGIYVEYQRTSDNTWREYGMTDHEEVR